MGLSHYPSAAEGMLPLLVMNTVFSVALLKNLVRSVLQVMGGIENPSSEENPYVEGCSSSSSSSENQTTKEKRISITSFKSLCHDRSSCNIATTNSGSSSSMECCVCLHKFEADEKVSELSCNHFFHKGCLEKWLDHKSNTVLVLSAGLPFDKSPMSFS